MYQALYRKYRPKNFDELVGQDPITLTIKNEIATGRIGHAYLFTGSRGTGKTSCSKIIAKAVNCPNQSDGNPCGVCAICTGVDDGSLLDVMEIDAASNNSVDDIRKLREEANFTPAIAKYRVYIIDETHMLTASAFNALLKIMEEPPKHVIFILATTEIHKIPPTILSRCQRFDFKRIQTEIIESQLLEVCGKESINLEKDAANLIARLSEGGMRDAFSLLDVCRSNSDVITIEVVEQVAGLAMQEYLFLVGDAVIKKDVSLVIKTIDSMYDASIDFEKMCVQMIAHYRALMMAKAVNKLELLVIASETDIQKFKKQAELYSMPHILYSLTVLQDALSRMSKTSQRRTELEMALIKISEPSMEASSEAILTRLTHLETTIKSGKFVQKESASKQISQATNLETQNITSDVLIETGGDDVSKSPVDHNEAQEQYATPAQLSKFDKWPQVLEQLQAKNKALHGFLIRANAYLDKEVILIDCDDPLFLEMMRSSDVTKKTIHDAIIEASGRDYRIGPFRKKLSSHNQDSSDPLEHILDIASKEGVNVVITDK